MAFGEGQWEFIFLIFLFQPCHKLSVFLHVQSLLMEHFQCPYKSSAPHGKAGGRPHIKHKLRRVYPALKDTGNQVQVCRSRHKQFAGSPGNALYKIICLLAHSKTKPFFQFPVIQFPQPWGHMVQAHILCRLKGRQDHA